MTRLEGVIQNLVNPQKHRLQDAQRILMLPLLRILKTGIVGFCHPSRSHFFSALQRLGVCLRLYACAVSRSLAELGVKSCSQRRFVPKELPQPACS